MQFILKFLNLRNSLHYIKLGNMKFILAVRQSNLIANQVIVRQMLLAIGNLNSVGN